MAKKQTKTTKGSVKVGKNKVRYKTIEVFHTENTMLLMSAKKTKDYVFISQQKSFTEDEIKQAAKKFKA